MRPKASVESADDEILNKKLEKIGNCGHTPFVENPAKFIEVVLTFLRRDHKQHLHQCNICNVIFECNCIVIDHRPRQHHNIEIFSANCLLCKHITNDIEIGKCEGCKQIVYDVNKMTEEIKVKMKNYGIKAMPTTIIDGNIKVVGIPDFPWICRDDLYKTLKKEYSLE